MARKLLVVPSVRRGRKPFSDQVSALPTCQIDTAKVPFHASNFFDPFVTERYFVSVVVSYCADNFVASRVNKHTVWALVVRIVRVNPRLEI